MDKLATVPYNASEGLFTITVTNISTETVTITDAVGSCHCTVAQLPSVPWKLAPKQVGVFTATMQLDGTPPGNTKFKTLTLTADKGSAILYLKTFVMPQPAEMTEADRTNNMKLSRADRQAVFKGNCIECHAAPAKDDAGEDRMGLELYSAVCGVCHEATRRATFVPDLHKLAEPTSAEFWRNWIMHGKPGTLMPAFAQSEGGILSEAQIASLVNYLSFNIPTRPAPAATGGK